MKPVNFLTEKEIREVAEAFADYQYTGTEQGMFFAFPNRQKLMDYLENMLRVALSCNMVYTTSERHEGIIVLTDTTNPMPFQPMMQLFSGMIKALGLKNFMNFTKACQSGGGSLEMSYRKGKKQFVQIEMLAVRKQYQGQGFMRPLIHQAFELADLRKLPVIITTDDSTKKDKYVHCGLTLVNTRQVRENAFLYDMVRECTD